MNDLLKHFDLKIYLGGISTVGFGSLTASNVETGLRITAALITICVGIATFLYTLEKRRFLKERRREAED